MNQEKAKKYLKNFDDPEIIAQIRENLLEVGEQDSLKQAREGIDKQLDHQLDHQIGMSIQCDIEDYATTMPTDSKKKWAIETIAEMYSEYLHGTAIMKDCSKEANFQIMGEILGKLTLFIGNYI